MDMLRPPFRRFSELSDELVNRFRLERPELFDGFLGELFREHASFFTPFFTVVRKTQVKFPTHEVVHHDGFASGVVWMMNMFKT